MLEFFCGGIAMLFRWQTLQFQSCLSETHLVFIGDREIRRNWSYFDDKLQLNQVCSITTHHWEAYVSFPTLVRLASSVKFKQLRVWPRDYFAIRLAVALLK